MRGADGAGGFASGGTTGDGASFALTRLATAAIACSHPVFSGVAAETGVVNDAPSATRHASVVARTRPGFNSHAPFRQADEQSPAAGTNGSDEESPRRRAQSRRRPLQALARV